MVHFTPLSALAGGLLIGTGATLLLGLNGRIAGVSGVLGGLMPPVGGWRTQAWRVAFLLGLVLGAGAWVAMVGAHPLPRTGFPIAVLVVSGLLVGYGTGISGGCTSGHGVCGLARLSVRSLVAVALFLGTAIITTGVARHVLRIIP